MTLLIVDGDGLNTSDDGSSLDVVDLGDVLKLSPRPCPARYRDSTIISGRFSPPIVWREDLAAAFVVGIHRPSAPPVLATNGAGSFEGNVIAYFTWAHLKNTGERIAEGNPSEGSTQVAAVSNALTVSGIPSVAPDARTTHALVYLSIDGALPRRAATVPVGTTSVDIDLSVATLVENESLPTRLDADGSPLADFDGRGVPPDDAELVLTFKHRSFWTKSRSHPARIWWSLPFEPETVNNAPPDAPGQNAPGYLDTSDGEAVTGIGSHGDQILLFYATGSYEIANYGGDSFVMRKRTSRFGCISHWSIKKVADEVLAWASQEGVVIYNGQFYSVMSGTHRQQWREEYEANSAAFEDAQGAEDKKANVYKLLIFFGGISYYYIGHYLGSMPTVGGMSVGEWEWTRDKRARRDRSMGNVFLPGSLNEELYTGSCDGRIRRENVDDNGDDDGDAFQKKMIVQPKHFFPDGQDGDDQSAATCHDISLFIRNREQPLLAEAYGGDDKAYEASEPHWSKQFPPGLTTVAGKNATERTSRFAKTPGLSGKGFSFRFSIVAPVRVEFRGFGFTYSKGAQSRRA